MSTSSSHLVGNALLMTSLLSVGLCQQMFSSQPQSVLVAPGRNISLTCKVDKLAGECRWQKDGKPVGMFAGKYSMDGKSGDCSLTISSADLKLDDGDWECQVTPSSFSSQDSLSSAKARLTIQVPPKSISLKKIDGAEEAVGGLVTLTEGKEEVLVCVTRNSNPAPTISWMLSDVKLASTSQSNTTEDIDSNKWKSEAKLNHTFSKSDMGKNLFCIVEHTAYPKGEEKGFVTLDILYKPSVSISRVASGEGSILEEGVGGLSLKCRAEANPPATIIWTKVQSGSSPQYSDMMEFKPVTRQHAGQYECQAENSVGKSEAKTTNVEVLFGPSILRTQPSVKRSVVVGNKTVLSCEADGNPAPKYQWMQQLSQQQVIKRSYGRELVIESVGYSDQGDYVCMAVNMVGNEKKETQSSPVKLEVSGVPQVVKNLGDVVGVNGHDVRLEAEFCSDPVPLINTWEWDGVVLPAGSEVDGRYKAELVSHPHMEDCYISRLTVRGVGQRDSRSYKLNVENKHGRDTVPVLLNIRDPVSMASVIGIVITLLVIFLTIVICLLVAYKRQKLCFKEPEKPEKGSTNGFGGNVPTYITGSGSKLSLTKEGQAMANTLGPSTGSTQYLPPSTKV